MFKTLYRKLTAVFLVLLLLLGILYIGLTLFTTRMFLHEVNQKLNRTLADHLVAEKILLSDGKINDEALKDIFHMLMVINPTIEIYLLDPKGTILAYSAPPGKVKRKQVSLVPLKQFLGQDPVFPLFGDNPRDETHQKVFSVAPISVNNQLQGYLYVILGGEAFDTTAQILQGSYILRLSTWALVGGILFTLVAGLFMFNLLTRRLSRLTKTMETFQKGNFSKPLDLSKRYAQKNRDEIDQLGITFHDMAECIQDQMNKLKETDKLRRELVANVSHDLRTPLAALQGYLETLQLKEGRLSPEEQREYLSIATRHSKRLGKLISELFELARLDSHETKPHEEVFSISELVQDVAQKFKLTSEKKGIHIQTNLDPDLPFVSADIGLIERVLENLMENALRFTPGGGSITINLMKNGEAFKRTAPQNTREKEDQKNFSDREDHSKIMGKGQVVIEVSDTGCGIPPEEIPYIFHRFYRVSKSSTSEGDGAGLGLAVAQRILELHGSPIEVKSTLNSGTTFTFYLPISKAQ